MLELKSDSLRATFTTLGARLVSLDFAGADCVMGGGTDEDILAGDWTTGAIAAASPAASPIRASRSRSTASNIRWRKTSASTSCTAGRTISRSATGKYSRRTMQSALTSTRPMATRAIRAPSTPAPPTPFRAMCWPSISRRPRPSPPSSTSPTTPTGTCRAASAAPSTTRCRSQARIICRSATCCCRAANSASSPARAMTSARCERSAASTTIAGRSMARAEP